MEKSEISKLKSETDLIAWVRKDVKLKQQGKWWIGLCPFHDDTKPSFRVNAETWHCFVCNEGGDILEWMKKYHDLEFREAIRTIGGELTVKHMGDGSHTQLMPPLEDFDARVAKCVAALPGPILYRVILLDLLPESVFALGTIRGELFIKEASELRILQYVYGLKDDLRGQNMALAHYERLCREFYFIREV